jgi:hypothetical protein
MEKQRLALIAGTILVLIVIFAVFAVIFGAFVQNFSPAAQGYGYGQGPGGENAAAYGQGGNSPVLLPMTDTGPLTHEEMADIMFMREEEQLAHDLYIRWAALYPLPVFSNIAGSETMHIYEVQLLMDRYGLPNNQTGDATVGYHSPVIQSLYDSLGPQGDTSLTAALEAGIAVEERDIADLDNAIANTTRSDVLQVWENLRQGSENHKRAFLRALGR